MAIKAFLKGLKPTAAQAEAPSPKKKEDAGDGGHDESNWLVSYADMMTLLCGFFIMLFSMATLDKPKFVKVGKEVSEHFGGQGGAYESDSPNKKLGDFVTQLVKEAGIEKETTVKSDDAGVAITFHSTIFFDSLSATLRQDSRKILEDLARTILARQAEDHGSYDIVVEGHTDSRPILSGDYPSNWELSAHRASQVVRIFLNEGVDPTRVAPIGYADTRPEVPDRNEFGELDEAALGKNRRVVVRINTAH